jgi:hypothetical protein
MQITPRRYPFAESVYVTGFSGLSLIVSMMWHVRDPRRALQTRSVSVPRDASAIRRRIRKQQGCGYGVTCNPNHAAFREAMRNDIARGRTPAPERGGRIAPASWIAGASVR